LEDGLNEKKVKQLTVYKNNGFITLPSVSTSETIISATPKKVFSNARDYHINSISLNSDGETYFSADDLRVNHWNLEINDQISNVVDIKPNNMEELTEVITSAEFHPINCNHFVYSTSKGVVKLADLRAYALCDNHSKLFEEEEDPVSRSSLRSFLRFQIVNLVEMEDISCQEIK
jgi:serine/threonine-protein phosphatase 2A regulatory subunit B